MIERELTKDEFIQLCIETKEEAEIEFYEQTKPHAVEKTGFIDKDGKPVYFAWLTKKGSIYHCWTLYSFDITEKIKMFRLARDRTKAWAEKYGAIHSTMEEGYPECLRWVKRMGFKVISRENNLIQSRLEG